MNAKIFKTNPVIADMNMNCRALPFDSLMELSSVAI